MPEAKLTGTIIIGESSAPSASKVIDAVASSIGIGGSFTRKWAAAPTSTEVIITNGAGKLIDTSKNIKFLHLKFYETATGLPIQGIVTINGTEVMPVQTEVFMVCNAGTAAMTSIGVHFGAAGAYSVDVTYASD